MLDEIPAKAALNAQKIVVRRTIGPYRADNLPLIYLEADCAADATIGADSLHLVDIEDPSLAPDELGLEGAGGADADAVAAENAGAVFQAGVQPRGDLRFKAPVGEGVDVGSHLLRTHVNTPAAQDALVVVPDEKGIVFIGIVVFDIPLVRASLHPVLVSVGLQAAVPCLLTGKAVFRMVGQQKVQDLPAGLYYPGRFRSHHHPFPDGGAAGRRQGPQPFHLDDAQPAGADDG